MAYLLDEKKAINENIFKYEERMNSQVSRFIDKTPTFVTYYNINLNETSTDTGLGTVERVLGPDSPVRFKQITDFPLYGLDQILLDLTDSDGVLTSDYDGQLVVLPNTLVPLPNDFFTINYLSKDYTFQVTEIAYDTIKSNNFYRLSFSIHSTDGSDLPFLAKQTVEKYNCILTNIGTKEKCLIREDEMELLIHLNKIYANIAQRYQVLFFNNRYNNFLFITPEKYKIYDKYLSNFINMFGLFNQKNDFNTLYLNVEDKSPTFSIEYEESFYRSLERGDKIPAKDSKYALKPINDFTSIFTFYMDRTVKSVNMTEGEGISYLPQDLVDSIASGDSTTITDIRRKTIVDYLNSKVDSIYKVDLEALSKFSSFIKLDFETFTLVPILLYILRVQYNKFMSVE